MFGKIFGYDSSQSDKPKSENRIKISKEKIKKIVEQLKLSLAIGFFLILIGGTIYFCYLGYQKDQKFKAYKAKYPEKFKPKPHANAIPFVAEPDFEEVVQELEANEEIYMGLFPNFDRNKDVIKLCYVDNYEKDVYYLKDGKGIKYRIGYGYNLGFHLDSMRLKSDVIIKADLCQTLNL